MTWLLLGALVVTQVAYPLVRDRAPLVMVNDSWHECLAPEDARALAETLRTKGEAALSGCHHQKADRGQG